MSLKCTKYVLRFLEGETLLESWDIDNVTEMYKLYVGLFVQAKGRHEKMSLEMGARGPGYSELILQSPLSYHLCNWNSPEVFMMPMKYTNIFFVFFRRWKKY